MACGLGFPAEQCAEDHLCRVLVGGKVGQHYRFRCPVCGKPDCLEVTVKPSGIIYRCWYDPTRGKSRRPRGQPQSNGSRRAKMEAAKLHKKAARQNAHASRVWARRVVDDHQVIAVEDFKPMFLAKSTMARKSADAAIGTAKRELIERGKRAGRKVVPVPPAYTTMTCSECGTRAKERLTLAERVFVCTACGCVAGRDANAARVILAQGERILAGADDIRQLPCLPSGVAGGMRSELEIPRL